MLRSGPIHLPLSTFTARAGRPARLLLADLAQLWITLAVLGVAVAVCLLVRNKDGINAVALMLQLFGTGVVVWDVLGRWRLFRRRTPSDWYREFVASLRKPRVIEAVGIAAGSVAVAGTVSAVKIRPSREAALEERIAAIEEQVRHLEKDSKARDAEQHKAHAALRADIQREMSELRTTLGEHAMLIEKIGGSGLSWELAGVAWIIGGTVLSTFSERIAQWIG